MERQAGTKKGILILFGLGLMLMLVLACTSREGQVTGAVQQNNGQPVQASAASDVSPANNAMMELAERRAMALGASATFDGPMAARQGIMVSGRGRSPRAGRGRHGTGI